MIRWNKFTYTPVLKQLKTGSLNGRAQPLDRKETKFWFWDLLDQQNRIPRGGSSANDAAGNLQRGDDHGGEGRSSYN
jgi:hypothetical protein